jgi:hypothetical protein
VPNEPIRRMPLNIDTNLSPNLREAIQYRAYELYEARGREDGHDVEDWLRAEAEIIGGTEEAAAA